MQRTTQYLRNYCRRFLFVRRFSSRDPPAFDENIPEDKIKKKIDKEKDKAIHHKVESRIPDAPQWDEKLGSASGENLKAIYNVEAIVKAERSEERSIEDLQKFTVDFMEHKEQHKSQKRNPPTQQ